MKIRQNWINHVSLLKVFAMLTLGLPAYSQSNFQKGLYVTNELDTIHGFIDQKEWIRNPISFAFKNSLDQNEKNLGLDKAKYFEVSDFEFYQRHYVSISMNEVQLGKASNRVQPRNDTVFLRLLEAGQNCTLFSYKDDVKQRFYIKGALDSSPYELINSVEMTADGSKLTVEKFKGQLYTLAAKAKKLTPEVEWHIKKLSYTPNSITKVVNLINGEEGKIKSKLTKIDNIEKNRSFIFYLGLGLSKSDLIYSSGPDWSKSSASSYNPYFHFGIKYFPNSSVRRFFLNTELSMSYASFSTTANNLTSYHPEQINYTFNQQNKGIYLGLNYSFYNTSKFTWFGGVGGRLNLCSYSNNLYTITETYPTYVNVDKTPNFFDLSPQYYSFSIRTGATFHERIEMVLDYSLPVAINQYTLWTEKIAVARFAVNYMLTKPKSPK